MMVHEHREILHIHKTGNAIIPAAHENNPYVPGYRFLHRSNFSSFMSEMQKNMLFINQLQWWPNRRLI